MFKSIASRPNLRTDLCAARLLLRKARPSTGATFPIFRDAWPRAKVEMRCSGRPYRPQWTTTCLPSASNPHLPPTMKAELRNRLWHNHFKTPALAQAATFGLGAADTTPITDDNTHIHANVPSVNSTSANATHA